MELESITRDGYWGNLTRTQLSFMRVSDSDAKKIEEIVERYARVWFIGFKTKSKRDHESGASKLNVTDTIYAGYSLFHGGVHYSSIAEIQNKNSKNLMMTNILPKNKCYDVLQDILDELHPELSVVAKACHDKIRAGLTGQRQD